MHTNGNATFSVDEWLVEPELNRISFGDEIHYLRPQVMDLLVYLARRNGQVVSTEELLSDLWVGRIVSHGTVYNCIAELRQALTNGHDSGAEIENIPKKGYRLVAEIKGGVDNSSDAPAARQKTEPSPLVLHRIPLSYRVGGVLALAIALTAVFGMRVSPLTMTSATQLSGSQILFPPVPSSYPLVTDGSRIYFNDWESGQLGLRQMLAAGGDAIRMDAPFGDANTLTNPQSVTPDGSSLLITSFTPGKTVLPSLWLWPLLGGPPRHIGEAVSAIFSPDGARIAWTNEKGELLIADRDMRNPQTLASMSGRIFWPVFSPDGQRIRFSVRSSAIPSTTIWEVSVSGGEPTLLLPDWSIRSHCCGSWTPDGDHYIFQAIDNGRSQIWAAEDSAGLFGFSGMEPYELTRGPIDFRRPTVSLDGRRVFSIGWQLRGEVVRYEVATQSFVAIPELDSVSAEWLAYSGDWIAYISYPDATLWVSKRDGSGARQLSFAPLVAREPVWSPDGDAIAFEGQRPGEQKRIFTVSLESGQVGAAVPGDSFQWSPAWSRDGSKIAFNEAGKKELQLLEISTGNISVLADTENLYGPRWSADGKYIVATGEEGLELYDVKNSSREVIVEETQIEGYYWDSSNQHVFFYDPFWRADARSVYKVNIHSKDVEKVADVGNVRSTWGVDGMWIGPGPDDEPVLLRDLSIHHIYALDVTAD